MTLFMRLALRASWIPHFCMVPHRECVKDCSIGNGAKDTAIMLTMLHYLYYIITMVTLYISYHVFAPINVAYHKMMMRQNINFHVCCCHFQQDQCLLVVVSGNVPLFIHQVFYSKELFNHFGSFLVNLGNNQFTRTTTTGLQLLHSSDYSKQASQLCYL